MAAAPRLAANTAAKANGLSKMITPGKTDERVLPATFRKCLKVSTGPTALLDGLAPLPLRAPGMVERTMRRWSCF